MKHQLRENTVPFALSFIFSGFGQIAKREYLKGIDFILIQILFIFCLLSEESILFKSGMIGLPIFWIINLLDAGDILTYKAIFLSETREKLLILIPVLIIIIIITTLLFSWIIWKYQPKTPEKQHFIEYSKAEVKKEQKKTPEEYSFIERYQKNNKSQSSSSLYLISLGAFKISENANKFSKLLRNNGYNTKFRFVNDKKLVYIDGFDNLEKAKEKSIELSNKGFSCYVALSKSPSEPIFNYPSN